MSFDHGRPCVIGEGASLLTTAPTWWIADGTMHRRRCQSAAVGDLTVDHHTGTRCPCGAAAQGPRPKAQGPRPSLLGGIIRVMQKPENASKAKVQRHGPPASKERLSTLPLSAPLTPVKLSSSLLPAKESPPRLEEHGSRASAACHQPGRCRKPSKPAAEHQPTSLTLVI